MKAKVDEFEKASGIDISHSWKIGKIGNAVSIISNGGAHKHIEALKRIEVSLNEISKGITSNLEVLATDLADVPKIDN